ncbi:Tn3 family transposase [Rhizobium ruizarguesonis]
MESCADFGRCLAALAHLASDEALGIAELRSQLQGLIGPFETDRQATQVALIRQELAHQSKELDRLLRAARSTNLAMPSNHKITEAFATLDNLSTQSSPVLPAGTANPFDAGDSLGKLLRTLYLCHFLGNPVFRYEILDLLNQGEAVHCLQRAIHDGTS